MAALNFQKQAAGMKKLREMLVKANRYAEITLREYVLAGGSASVSGVELNLQTSIAQLDRMITDCEGRVKMERQERSM